MKNRTLPIFAVIAVLSACDGSTDTADATNVNAVEAGKAIFDERCADCHGTNLEGQPYWQVPNADGTVPPPPLNDEGTVWQRSDQLLFRSIKLGGEAIVSGFHSAMPGFEKNLTDEQIWQVLSYIKSRWSPMIRARQERMNTK